MAKYKLYGWSLSGSMAVDGALAEVGADYDYVEIDAEAEENRTPEFLKINPRGQVPVVVLPDGTVVTESPAILVHLADAFPAAGLVPAPGTSARATHDRWLAFAQANIYEGMLRFFYSDRYTTDPAGTDGVKAAADAYINRHFKIFDEALAGSGPFLFGEQLSVVDIYVWVLCHWIDMEALRKDCPNLGKLFDAANARPALKAVAVRNGA